MDDAIITNGLKDLVHYLNSNQTTRPGKAFEIQNANSVLARRGRNNVQELLDSLGFGLKYLLFDLEATRRENAVLRSIIADDD